MLGFHLWMSKHVGICEVYPEDIKGPFNKWMQPQTLYLAVYSNVIIPALFIILTYHNFACIALFLFSPSLVLLEC